MEGVEVPTAAAAPSGFPPTVPYLGSPFSTPPYLPSSYDAAALRLSDDRALSKVALAALLAIVGSALSFVTIFILSGSPVVQLSLTGSGNFTTQLLLIGFLLSAGALTFVELCLFWSAFSEIAPVDRRFSTPRILTVAAAVGLVLLLVGFVGLFATLLQGINCTGGGPTSPTYCPFGGVALGLLALAGFGSIIALVGFIGLIIGIWRLGTRYGEGLFKAGAILLIFVPVVGAVLVLLAARSARRRPAVEVSTQPFG